MHVNFLEPQYPYQGRPRKKMITVIFLSLVVGSLFIGTTWVGATVFGKETRVGRNGKIEQIDTSTFLGRVKAMFVTPQHAIAGADTDRVNVALLGIGGAGHDGGQLTDTILVASIKPSTKQVALISIPRDTLVEIPGIGWRKINEANALAEMEDPGSGGEKALQTLEKFLGIEIPYFVRIDFRGFEKLIDDLGGVDVYVDKSFTDTQFPTLDYKYRTVSFNKGWNHFGGAEALDFARSRHGNNFEGSDFARSRRQQKIIVAARDKALSTDTFLNPSRITNALETLDTHIKTNMSFGELLEFAQIARTIDTERVETLVFSDDPNSVLRPDDSSGAFYLRPKDPTLGQIHTIAQNIFDAEIVASAKTIIDDQPLKPDQAAMAKIELQNGTWRAGFASRQKKRLEADSFKVSAVGNAAEKPVSRTKIYNVTKRYDSVYNKLKLRFDAEELSERPAIAPDDPDGIPPGVDIIVILGENVPDIAE